MLIVNVLVGVPEHHLRENCFWRLNYNFWPSYMFFTFFFFLPWITFSLLFFSMKTAVFWAITINLMLFAFFTLGYVTDLNKVTAVNSFRNGSPWSLLPGIYAIVAFLMRFTWQRTESRFHPTGSKEHRHSVQRNWVVTTTTWTE